MMLYELLYQFVGFFGTYTIGTGDLFSAHENYSCFKRLYFREFGLVLSSFKMMYKIK